MTSLQTLSRRWKLQLFLGVNKNPSLLITHDFSRMKNQGLWPIYPAFLRAAPSTAHLVCLISRLPTSIIRAIFLASRSPWLCLLFLQPRYHLISFLFIHPFCLSIHLVLYLLTGIALYSLISISSSSACYCLL